MIIDNTLIEQVCITAVAAGKAILKIYHSGEKIHVSLKKDHSPLTIADKTAHDIIADGLEKIDPAIPVLSEEGADIPYETRRHWEYFWCVDPLDGTKEFIYRTDEFTVNIALIHLQKTVLGVIYVPAFDTLYYGSAITGSYRRKGEGAWEKLMVDSSVTEWTAIGSRSHASDEEKDVLSKYPVTNTIAAGSSLKFCRIAEGAAQIYYRHGPTMEWDTAAGQAIAENSGAIMTRPDGAPFEYNKISLLNSGFICKVM
ncbi:MAG: 3'(2'),5'-bisphosphate nucleotidase CysQ [Agriterribacter sp.]